MATEVISSERVYEYKPTVKFSGEFVDIYHIFLDIDNELYYVQSMDRLSRDRETIDNDNQWRVDLFRQQFFELLTAADPSKRGSGYATIKDAIRAY